MEKIIRLGKINDLKRKPILIKLENEKENWNILVNV